MRYLYTYLPKENTAQTQGILSTAKAPSGWQKYKQRSGKTTKQQVLAYLDSLDKDRSKAFSAFSAPIPVDSDPAFVQFAKKKELYKVDLARLLKAKRILSIYKTGIGKATHKVDKIDRTSWKDKHPGQYLFSNVPHYIVAVEGGRVPPEFIQRQPNYKQKMLLQIARIARKFKQPIFAVTQGASITRNNGSEAVKAARQAHAKWEDQHGGDSKQDWLNKQGTMNKYAVALSQLKRYAKPHYTPDKWQHILNVLRIAKEYKEAPLSDEQKAAILWHDSAKRDMGAKLHGLHGAQIARKELSRWYTPQQVRIIAKAIRQHNLDQRIQSQDTFKPTLKAFASPQAELLAVADDDRGATQVDQQLWKKILDFHVKGKTKYNTPQKLTQHLKLRIDPANRMPDLKYYKQKFFQRNKPVTDWVNALNYKDTARRIKEYRKEQGL